MDEAFLLLPCFPFFVCIGLFLAGVSFRHLLYLLFNYKNICFFCEKKNLLTTMGQKYRFSQSDSFNIYIYSRNHACGLPTGEHSACQIRSCDNCLSLFLCLEALGTWAALSIWMGHGKWFSYVSDLESSASLCHNRPCACHVIGWSMFAFQYNVTCFSCQAIVKWLKFKNLS